MRERMEGFVLAFVLILSECVWCGYIGLDWNEHWHGVWSVVVVMGKLSLCVVIPFAFCVSFLGSKYPLCASLPCVF
jgi:hypothetical protein